MAQIIIGTAGHIDHGKTALVKALTGVNTDRLREEQERGLTIDLGFAHLGDRATIIDVPGHEKFIRNMVAGVSTIDLVLLVVAADDGVMPQTREHLDILKILQVRRGIIVITKIDLVDRDWLSLVIDDVRSLVAGTFLEGAPIMPVSAVTDEGIPELKKELEKQFTQVQRRNDRGLFWMPIDRAFTIHGFGTVVTGTVLSGRLHTGESIDLLPRGKTVKVRGLQSHGRNVDEVSTGDRAAINLQGVEKDAVQRGDVLAAARHYAASQRFDVRLNLLQSAPRPLKNRARVRVHFGTTEVMARALLVGHAELDPGDSTFAQLLLEKPAVARRLDPLVIRQYSPTLTIGGGVVLDANAPRHKMSDPALVERLQELQREDPEEVLEARLLNEESTPLTLEQMATLLGLAPAVVSEVLRELAGQNKIVTLTSANRETYFHRATFDRLADQLCQHLETFHRSNPTKVGIGKAELPRLLKHKVAPELLSHLINELKRQRRIAEVNGAIKLQSHELTLSAEQTRLKDALERVFWEKAFAPPSLPDLAAQFQAKPDEIENVLALLVTMGQLIRVDGGLYFHSKRVAEAREKTVAFLKKNQTMTVSQFKELLGGTTRKYAMPLLNYFDGLGITERDGDVRILGDRATS